MLRFALGALLVTWLVFLLRLARTWRVPAYVPVIVIDSRRRRRVA